MAKQALGRGLGALLGGVPPQAIPPPPVATVTPSALAPLADTSGRVQQLALSQIRPCSFQPRKQFTPEALQELADSIKEQGVIQPLIVRQRENHFELIAGERRWRAAQLLGLREIPAVVREADDRTVLELALIENLQRENLNPLEEAHGYSELIDKFELRQEDVAGRVGKSRAVVANALRLLKLAPEVQNYLRDGRLSVGHAKVILGLNGAKEQNLAAERVIKRGLNVRQTETLVAQWLHAAGPRPLSALNGKTPAESGTHIADLENRLRERLGTKVQLRFRHGKGSLEIRFFSAEDLDRLLRILGVTSD